MSTEHNAEKDALADAWAKRLPEPTPDSFGVQHYTDWSDYPDWEDRYDWDAEDEPPIRFATAEDARAWLDAEEAVWFEKAHAEWRKRKVRADAANELYRARRQCLIDNGLWVQDGENISPLLGKAGPGWEPKRGWERRYRVVADAEMDEPTRVTPPGSST